MYELNWSLTYQVVEDTKFSLFDIYQMTFDLDQKQ